MMRSLRRKAIHGLTFREVLNAASFGASHALGLPGYRDQNGHPWLDFHNNLFKWAFPRDR